MDHPPERIEELLTLLASGESVKFSCGVSGVDKSWFYKQCAKDKDFDKRVEAARKIGVQSRIDEIVAIVDEAEEENHNVTKLKVWARMWEASKLNPKKYGDKIQAEIGGTDGGPLVITWKQPVKVVEALPAGEIHQLPP